MNYFGTDGIRGTYDDALINARFLKRVGYAIGSYLKEFLHIAHPKVAIGRDPRTSGEELEKALVEGLRYWNVQCFMLGVVPTPVVSFACNKNPQADLGIMITASHNPFNDNGIKLFKSSGEKLSVAEEKEIENFIDRFPTYPAAKEDLKNDRKNYDALKPYKQFIVSLCPKNFLKKKKFLIDTANGATTYTASEILTSLGAEVISMGDEPDGVNINDKVGSEHPQLLAKSCSKRAVPLGFAFDGDGDRVVFCDENSKIVDGDQILGLLALHYLRTKKLKNNTLVATIHSNMGLDNAIKEAGGTVFRTQVGDRNVYYSMKEQGSNLGGESSGHVIFGDIKNTGDGLLTLLQVLMVMEKTQKRLADLRTEITLYPQVNLSLKVAEKKPLECMSELQEFLAMAEKELGNQGRVLVRYSGTENKIRLLSECENPQQAFAILRRIEKIVHKELSIIG
ncbi:MAG: phosphoglucosamine mutase [Verrucomicrobia bacterium GWC2_42_7]|nr:MAG: phosphoglucosamine mutase [Verrucomicrobia bacterium GWC2_42_7]